MRKGYILLLLLFLSGCAPAAQPDPSPPPPVQAAIAPASISAPEPEPPEPDPRQEAIDDLLSSMTAEEMVGQLFFARCPSNDPGGEIAAEYHLGGYLLFGRDFKDKSAQEVKDQIAVYQAANSLPMLIGVDEEGGTVVRVSANPQLREERFPSPQQLYNQGGLEAVLDNCREKDALLRSLGVNVNFAPVCDLSSNPRDFIYDRTLGLDAEGTSTCIAAVAEQMQADGMGSVLKHFPGYGPNKDTHTGSALDQRPLETFQREDFLPFQAGVDAGGGTTAVLVSHNVMQAVDPDRPASLSPAVYGLLREELDFHGPALTDDLAMDAITRYARTSGACPAVLALAAGCDMVVTTDFQSQIPQVLAALEDGTLSRQRVEEAAARVLGWKYDLGLLPPA
ncbi:MAG: beta-hexosaminidase [Lawsonibacter sp.]|nr:beta-hexosaminidase [Lawsonibacter sp.]